MGKPMPKAEALSNRAALLITEQGDMYVMETQQDYEDGSTPAKSIWLNVSSAKLMQDALNRHYGLPKEEEKEQLMEFMRSHITYKEGVRTTVLEEFYQWQKEKGLS